MLQTLTQLRCSGVVWQSAVFFNLYPYLARKVKREFLKVKLCSDASAATCKVDFQGYFAGCGFPVSREAAQTDNRS